MAKSFDTVIVGGGCLGCASAFSISRRLGNRANKVAIVEKKVLGSGLSSRHSAIVRSANASTMAARMAKIATHHWKHLISLWGVAIQYEQPGAIWIAENSSASHAHPWLELEKTMKQESIDLHTISHRDVEELCHGAIRLSPEERYFYESDVLQLDSSDILHTLQEAVKINRIDVIEHCQVNDFELDGQGNIVALQTSQGQIDCGTLVNAAGGWSADLFSNLDIHLPVALEAVHAANFLVSSQDIPASLPIIADFINCAYFRRWRGSILHMHQPRSRLPKDIGRTFGRAMMNTVGADVIYDASSFGVNHQQVEEYIRKVENRFPRLGQPVYAGGYRSFFDITPDLKFILGKDNQIPNLFHCLGAGQALKYAPIMGEIIADLTIAGKICNPQIDIGEFSIERFERKAIESFWKTQEPECSAL